MHKLFCRFGAPALAALLLAAPAAAETIDVTFLLVNDVDRMGERDGRGGYARIAAVVEAERAARDNVVFIHAGDAISPSLLSGFDQGAHIMTLINMTAPDIFVPGNHEYDFGPEVFRNRMSEAEFPLLAANLRDASDQILTGFEDSRVMEFGGIKIGMVGLTADDSYSKSSPGDLMIASAVETGIEEAERLRAEGAQIVVAIAHTSRPTDRELFESRAFDLIFSGDDHDLQLLYDGRTVLVESFTQGEYVSAVDLAIETEESDGAISVEWRPGFRIIDTAEVEPDAAVQEQIASFEADFSEELDVVIGRTATDLDSRRATVRTGEAAIGNLIADAIRETVDADVALMNGGGIRADRIYEAGSELTRKDILAELPFGNRTVKIEVTGDILHAALEHGFGAVEESSGRFPQISGMVVDLDLSAPAGSRVQSVTVNGEPLDPARAYTLATNDFNAAGGDGYEMFSEAPRILNERDGPLLAAAVMAHIRKIGEVTSTVEGRIKTDG